MASQVESTGFEEKQTSNEDALMNGSKDLTMAITHHSHHQSTVLVNALRFLHRFITQKDQLLDSQVSQVLERITIGLISIQSPGDLML
jgi:hypothetical protein